MAAVKNGTASPLSVDTEGFRARVQLPAFPGDALAEWLEGNHFYLSLQLSDATVRRAAAIALSEGDGNAA